MNLFEQMDAKASSFTKTDHFIYTQCKKFTESFATSPISSLTEKNNVSQAALTRFAQKLGFTGFSEFQYALSSQIKQGTAEAKEKTPAQSYADALIETEKALTPEVLRPILDKVNSSNDIYTSGSNISSLAANYLIYALKIAKNCHSEFLPIDAFPYTYPPHAVIFIFSAETGTFYLQTLKNHSEKDKNPYVVLVTLNPKHPLRKHVNYTILLPRINLISADRNVLPETLSFLMFIDILLRNMKQ
jgi:DNA-binding MurR/RpiR family transcriptional regulator